MKILVIGDVVGGPGRAIVKKALPKVVARHGIDFTIGGGEIVVILGANGAGKTTTMRAICGLVHTEGSVRLDGSELVGKRAERTGT